MVLLVPADGGGGGSATEKALLAFGAKNGLDGSVMRSKTYNRVGEIPFSSERKYMAVQCVKSRYGHYHANFPPVTKQSYLLCTHLRKTPPPSVLAHYQGHLADPLEVPGTTYMDGP